MSSRFAFSGESLALFLRRFLLEALCLLLLLQGYPAQALESLSPESVETGESESSAQENEPSLAPEKPLDQAKTAATAILEGGLEALDQPWGSAVGLMLGLTAYAVPQGRPFANSPPDPPFGSESGASKVESIGPDSLAMILDQRDALTAIPLLPGFNLVSLPKAPLSSDPASILAPIAGTYTKVFTYDGCAEGLGWLTFDPSDPTASNLTELGTHLAFQVRSTSPADLPVDGTLADSTTMTLCAGWNLIGYPAAQPRHVLNVFAPIRDKLLRIFEYDPFRPDDTWEFWDAQAPDWANGVKFLRPGYGYWVLVSENVTFEVKNVAVDPNVSFTAPQDLDVVTAPTDVFATIESAILDTWTLRYRAVGDPDWIELTSRPYPPAPGEKLATFDPTLLLNGLYELELTATDLAGRQVSDSIAVTVEGNMKIGHFTLSFVDLAIPVSGLDIEVVRTYDSRQRHLQGDFGYGWTLDILQGSYRNNRPPGDGWRIPDTEGPWGLPCSVVQETKSHLTTVRLSDQEVYRFRLALRNPSTVIGGCFAEATFEWIDGPVPGTTLEILGNTQVFAINGSDEVVVPDTQEPFVPEDVKLTTRDGRIFHLDLSDGVTHLEDLNGNFLEINAQGITHSSGRGIDFERDAEGRLARITDPLGASNRYEYDAEGDLLALTDRADATSRFTYTGEHYLEEVENALGVRAIRTEYDQEGRVREITDAAGKPVKLRHDLDARQEIITNRLGFVRVLEYDGRGNVVREVDELGATTLRTYDPEDRVLSETDPLGRTTTYEYTASGHRSRWVRPMDRVIEIEFNPLGLPTLVRDALGQESFHSYDASGNLIQTVDVQGGTAYLRYGTAGVASEMQDAMGSVQQFEADSFGQLLSWSPPEGSPITYTYDANGRSLSETQVRTKDGVSESITTSYEYDSMGRLLLTRHPDGTTEAVAYDLLGRIKSTKDGGGNETHFGYDSRNRLTSVSHPDDTVETVAYDDEDRLVSRTDADGHTWQYTYDPVGRLETLEAPDSGQRAFSHDSAGQLLAVRDELGFETQFTYDAAGRRVRQTDALGNETLWTYDSADRLTTETDANGNSVLYQYDGLGRLIRTSFPDGATEELSYDLAGHLVSRKDQHGIETSFVRDAVGRLLEVEVAGYQTVYRYDELGNLIEIVDALGRSTKLGYDNRSRLIARTLPDGAQEEWTYEFDGQISSHQRLEGGTRTFDYDSRRRMTEWADTGGIWARFTYWPTGSLRTAENSHGTTEFAYDSVGRMARKTDPGGSRLDFTYDRAGRRIQLRATVGEEALTTSTSYNALGRPTSLTDAVGGQYHFEYDAVGNRTRIEYPNSLATDRGYDSRHRLITTATTSADGYSVLNLSYARAPGGRVTQMTDSDGLTASYSYGPLGALTGEEVLDPTGELVRRSTYGYDAVGNRVSALFEGPSTSPTAVSYQYDSRNRMLSAGSESWNWDVEGRMIEHAGTTYSWDSSQRMSDVTSPEGLTTRFEYDALGHRLSTTTDQEGHSEEAREIVDTSGALSQRIAELSSSGLASWTRVEDELLATHGVGGTRYYHADALGSVRALTDSSGAISDEYRYTAFGELEDRAGGSEQPYGFAGEAFFEGLGLADHRARWMDPSIGRFVSPDPFEGTLELPWTLNAYPYVLGDPVNQRDPSGLIPDWLIRPLVGTAVHGFIGRDFENTTVPPNAGLSNRSIKTILGKDSLCYRNEADCRQRPDLANLVTFEVYEIKTTKGFDSGVQQLNGYLGDLMTYDRYARGWTYGTSYKPPVGTEISAAAGYWRIRIYDPVSGVITYDAERRIEIRPPSIPFLILTMSIISSIQMAIATRGLYV